MQLTVLGCAGTFPSAESGCSAYLVEHDDFRLLVDAGNGMTGALQRHAGLFDIDAVILSHLHADHWIDLIAYSYARRYHPDAPPRLPIYGPAACHERLSSLFPPQAPEVVNRVYDIRTTSPGTLAIGPFEIGLTQTAHPIECHAMRINAGGRTLVYSADTGPTQSVVDAARDADLFLCEATWQEGRDYPEDLHMTGRDAGEHAAKADAGFLLLTHTTAYHDHGRSLAEAASVYDGRLELAQAGQVYPV